MDPCNGKYAINGPKYDSYTSSHTHTKRVFVFAQGLCINFHSLLFISVA